MRTVRHRFRTPLGAVLLAALLLLPLAFSGHDHGTDLGASRSCGTCIAVRHTPSLGPAVVAATAPHVVELALGAAVAVARSTAAAPRRPGRAPPRPVRVAFV